MRYPLLPSLLLATLANSGAMAAGPGGSCDKYVGVWEYVAPSRPGRAIIAKHGDKYAAVWVSASRDRKVTTEAPSTDAEKAVAYSTAGGAAAEAVTCGPKRDRWRILYSTNPAEVGTEFEIESQFDGDDAKWWFVRPDGTRGDMGASRRLK